MTPTQTVLIELVVAAPIDEVWRALQDPAEIVRWFGWNHPGIHEEIDYIFKSASAEESDHRLYFEDTGDVFTLEARGDHTVVRITRAAPAEGSWDDIYDDVIEGWITFVQQLRFTLERHRRDDRRTLYFSGRTRTAADPRPPEALGLDALASAAVGDRITVRLATGDTVSGAVWFRSANQIGLTSDAFGDGLLVVTRRPTTAKSPHGGGMAVLTTYGLNDEAFEALRARWHAWWERAFELIEAQV